MKKVKQKHTIKTLPKVLSKLIYIALDDLAKAEANPKVEINMDTWQENTGTKCIVCLAGSVMRESLGSKLKPGEETAPERMGKNENQLYAINNLRTGDVEMAAIHLGFTNAQRNKAAKFNRHIPDYYHGGDFRPFMLELAYDLQKAGL